MKVKKYGEFVNEKISKETKFILKNLPYILGNKFISSLIGAAPLLSSKWKSLKNKSKGEWNYYGGGGPKQVKNNLSKIEISDLPDTPLKKGLYPLFNNWNIYKSDKKSKDSSVGPERQVFYISKDELKFGDWIVSSRESSWETEEEGTYKSKSGRKMRKLRTPTEDDPIFVLAAKYEVDEFLHQDFIDDLKDLMNYDIEDEGIQVIKTHTSLENDGISCEISEKPGYDNFTLNDTIISYLIANSQRTTSVLKNQTGKEWIYTVSFSTGNNTISRKNQVILIEHYQKHGFWENLSDFGLYSEERPDYLKRLFNSDDYKYAIEDLFGEGKFKTIYLVKNGTKVIEPYNLDDQKFDKINVYFKLKKMI